MLVSRRQFVGDLISKRTLIVDNFDQFEADKEDVHLYTIWLDLIQSEKCIDQRWATFTVFRDDVIELQGYVPFEMVLNPTYYGSNVYSAQTCVWMPEDAPPLEMDYLQVGEALYTDAWQIAREIRCDISMARYYISIGHLPDGRLIPTPSTILEREEL